MNKVTYKFIIRKDIPRRDGTCLLAIQAFINKKRVVIPLSIYVREENWDLKGEKVIAGKNGYMIKKDIDSYNMILGQARTKVNDLFINSRLLNKDLTREIFCKEFNDPSVRMDFLAFYTKECEELKGVTNPSTLKTYTETLKKIRTFKEEISFSEINYELIEKFNNHLIREKIGINTRWKHNKNFKKFIGLCISRGIPISNPYATFKTPRVQGNIIALSQKEVGKLIELYYKPELPAYLKNVLSYFLWSCFTGLRISDIHEVTAEMIVENTLVFVPKKTKNLLKMIKIPLTETARQFIETNSGKLFTPTTDQATNRALKTIAEMASINKTLTYHMSRHTFATIFLELGGAVEVLQKLLGHSKLETTMVYVHISQTRAKKEMEGFDKFAPKKTSSSTTSSKRKKPSK